MTTVLLFVVGSAIAVLLIIDTSVRNQTEQL